MGCCSMRRASTLISIPLFCWTTNQDGGRETRAKGWPTAHISQGQAFLLTFFFFHSLPLLVCEDGQLVFVPDTCVSLFFNCGHRERRGRERERNKQFWMNVVAIVLLCLIFWSSRQSSYIISWLCARKQHFLIHMETAGSNLLGLEWAYQATILLT